MFPADRLTDGMAQDIYRQCYGELAKIISNTVFHTYTDRQQLVNQPDCNDHTYSSNIIDSSCITVLLST